MVFSKWLAISGLIGTGLLCLLGGCSSKPTASEAAAGSSAVPVLDNPAGRPAASGTTSGGAATASPAAGSIARTSAAGSGGSAGSAGTTLVAAGSGHATGGAAAGSGGSGPVAGDGAAGDDDPLDALDPFGLGSATPAADSCEGHVCLEDADCASLYPDDAARCKFTRCEDLTCR